MSLKEYHHKRDFRRTREPRGQLAKRQNWLFVVQKHAASHLHYDFRLQLDGVLKSWAVPKGPSLDPQVKRLAMHVEDHPVDYGEFEGIIPQGEYGGGTVMLWDRGWWEPEGDPRAGYRAGKLKFHLHGEKLKGQWLLVRRGGKSGTGKEWLLFKTADDEAMPEDEGSIVEDAPKSVKSRRTMEQIAKAEDAVWSSNGGLVKSPPKKKSQKPEAAKTNSKTAAKARKSHATKPAAGRNPKASVSAADLPGAKAAKFETVVKRVQPQLATLTAEAPAGDQWLHEIKFDGYRMICRKDGERVQLFSRNENDWTGRFGALAEALKQLPLEHAILDGEVCAVAENGKTDFQELQNAMKKGRAQRIVYYVFDVLYADGYDLTKALLSDRKRFLESILPARSRSIVYSKHVVGNGPDYFAEACKLGLEGIISKRADRPYYMGRSADWLKVKCVKREEFVIGGYTDPSGSRIGFGSLLLGYYDLQQRLIYAGRVGTGFDTRSLKDLTKRLESLEEANSPFHDLTTRTGDARHAHWVRPELVGQVEFTEWTSDARLRHPSFQGLREDKPAEEVVRDRPVALAALTNGSSSNGIGEHSVSEKPNRVKRTSAKTAKKKSTAPASRSKRAASGGGREGKSAAVASKGDRVDVAGVSLSSPNKVLYREQDITKLELAQYYEAIGEWALPEIVNRPLVLVRCPEGTHKECFYQKHPGAGSSTALRQIPVKEKSKTEHYLVVDDLSGLVALVQMGVLEIHAWGSRADRIEQPDRLVFDLDPDPSVPFSRVIESAFEVRQFLEDLELTSFVKTTGGKGLHVVTPITRRKEWDEIKEFCKLVATAIVRAAPEHYTANMSKAARPGKIFFDYLRNGRGASAIVAYSTRAREGAPVAMPVGWEELRRLKAANQFNIQNAAERLRRLKKDPWADIASVRQSISAAARKKLERLATA